MIYISVFQFLLFQGLICHQEVEHTNKNGDLPHTAILYGNSTLGYYYVNLYIGEEMKKHSLIVDTGSSSTMLNCNQCHQCGNHQNPPYEFNQHNYNASEIQQHFNCSIKQQDRCTFQLSYVEGSSIQGFYFSDNVIFGDGLLELNNQVQDQEKFKSILGCTQFETGQLYSQVADGVLGLAPRTNASLYPPNIVDFIAMKENKELKREFSLCLGNNYGFMTIGGYDVYRHNQESQVKQISFTPKSQYKLNLSSIKFGEESITIDDKIKYGEQGIFIDSGATISYFDASTYQQLAQKLDKHFQENQIQVNKLKFSAICYNLSEEDTVSSFLSKFPNISFIFENNTQIDWLPEFYLQYENDAYCVGVRKLDKRILLGQNWMRGRDVLFDLDNNIISIVDAKCQIDHISLQVHQDSEQNQMPNSVNIRQPSEKEIIKEEENTEKVEEQYEEEELQEDEDENDDDEEVSWLEIVFYVFVLILILKGILFTGLYIMKKMGGHFYIYQDRVNRFKKINNQIHLEEDTSEDKKPNDTDLIIKEEPIQI